jgi:ABC-type sulfate transport system substrate-binding protein
VFLLLDAKVLAYIVATDYYEELPAFRSCDASMMSFLLRMLRPKNQNTYKCKAALKPKEINA